MNKKTLRIAGWALGLSMAVAGIGVAVGASQKAPIEAKAVGYEQLTSIASIDEDASYVLGIDGTGFHYSGTSSWGKTALPSAQTPLYYTLKVADDGKSFTAQTKISSTTYYLQVPTSNTFSMATTTGTNTDLIIGTTQFDETNYAVANKTTTARHLRINGSSGLRSYAGSTGTMAYFYKADLGPSVKIEGEDEEISVSVKETNAIVKTLTLSNVTMAELTVTSGNEGVATVTKDNENKKITINGVAYGTTDVTIKKGKDLLYTVHVSVTYNNTVTVSSAGDVTSLAEGDTLQLSAVSSKAEALSTTDTFTWSSSNNNIATVDSTGLVTGVREGSVTITATSNNYEGTSGSKELDVVFGSDYSAGLFYDSEELGNTSGSDPTNDELKSAFSGGSTVIDSISFTSGKVKIGKYGGLSMGTSNYSGEVVVTMKDAYKLKSVSLWAAKVDNGVSAPTVEYGTGASADTTATLLENNAEMFGKSEALDESAIPFTYTFASDAKTIKFSATKSTKWTIYKVILNWAEVKAESISFTAGSSFSLMNGLTKQLKIKASPLYYNVPFVGSTTWNSATPSVATVSSSGLVTGAADSGSSVVSATVNVGTVEEPVNIVANATVHAISNVPASVTIVGSDLASSFEVNGVTWAANKTTRYGNDLIEAGDIASYSRGGIKIEKDGYLRNSTASYFKINKVILALSLAGEKTSFTNADVTVAGSNTSAGGTDISSDVATSGPLKTFTLAEGCDYITISAAATQSFNSVTIEYASPVETIYSVADFILGLQPDRGGESINACTAVGGATYLAAKKRLYDAGSTVVANFQTSEDPTVMNARERYEYWAGSNGDAAPYVGYSISASKISTNVFAGSDSYMPWVVTAASVGLLATGGIFLISRRRREE